MKILVVGGTRFFGIPMIYDLLKKGHDVTIATRGTTPDPFGDQIKRIVINCLKPETMDILKGQFYDVIIHKIAYSSNDIKNILDRVQCNKFILMSSASVYYELAPNVIEEQFDETKHPLVWCNRQDYDYGEIKRQAECALAQCYPNLNWAAVRAPYVVGKNDYTQRLAFYVENAIKQIPMKITTPDSKISFIHEDEAGNFLSYLVDHPCQGPYNASSKGWISVQEILNYVQEKTGIEAILSDEGILAPYDGSKDFSVIVDKAEKNGFEFSTLNSWFYQLLDYYIEIYKNNG